MPDENTSTTTPPAPDASPAQGKSAEDLQAELARIKSEARKWEERAKENKTAAEELAQLREAGKSEAQRAADRAAKAEADAAAATLLALKVKAGAPHGIDESLIAGNSPEEIAASVAKLVEWRTAATPTPPRPPSPAGLRSGAGTDHGKPPGESAAVAALRTWRAQGR